MSALAVGPGEENWRSSFEVDLMHTVRLVRGGAAAPGGDEGSIVAVSTVSGREIDFVQRRATAR